MFEAAEVGHKVRKAEYETLVPQLRVDLVNAQYDLRTADFPVIIVIAGNDRAGCNDALRKLHEVMDARFMETNALGPPTEEELERPRFWRYWRRLPPRGRIGIFLGAWVASLIRERFDSTLDPAQVRQRIDHIRRFEEHLVNDGALILKFWLHLPKNELKKRLKQARKRPERAWQMDTEDWEIYSRYDKVLPIAEQVVRETSTGEAPWHVVESTDAHYRNLHLTRTILDSLTRRLTQPQTVVSSPGNGQAVNTMTADGPTILDTVDLGKKLPRSQYRAQLRTYQAQLNRLTRQAREAGLTSVLVFEGWDAAGKGGVIRRLISAMDPVNFQIVPIAAPTEEEKAHHYLWRFWRHLPRAGRVLIFDRSWYGRVLVERIEGFASEPEWRRAYSEINAFEEQLSEHGILLMKFWLHIDADEQMRRFQTRLETPYKKFKITEEDYRNREKWRAYELALHEMVQRTSTEYAPWHLVSANNKPWARVEVLKMHCRQLKRRLG